MGSANNVPFLPGGFDGEMEELLRFSDLVVSDCGVDAEEETKFLNFESRAPSVPLAPYSSYSLSHP